MPHLDPLAGHLLYANGNPDHIFGHAAQAEAQHTQSAARQVEFDRRGVAVEGRPA